VVGARRSLLLDGSHPGTLVQQQGEEEEDGAGFAGCGWEGTDGGNAGCWEEGPQGKIGAWQEKVLGIGKNTPFL